MFKIHACVMWGIIGTVVIAGLLGCTPKYTLEIDSDPEEGGTVHPDPAPEQDKYRRGSTIALEAVAASDYRFVAWGGDLAELVDDVAANPVAFDIQQNMRVVARFETVPEPEYGLNIIVEPAEGGAVTATPDQERYPGGTTITLEALPAQGYQFSAWEGDLVAVVDDTTATTIEFPIEKDMRIVARFTPIPQYTLTVASEPEGTGDVLVSPDQERYYQGTPITLEAIPSDSYEFEGWTGDLVGMVDDVTVNPIEFIIEQDMHVIGRFARISGEGPTEGTHELIGEPDDCYGYARPMKYERDWGGMHISTAYLVSQMTSQCWNPDNAVYEDYIEWTHPVTIIVPAYRVSDTAMLFIDGGSRNSAPEVEEALEYLAVFTGTTVVHIKNIPSQPIYFKDEVVAPGDEDNHGDDDLLLRRRTEDAIIAYSYNKYLESWRDNGGEPDAEWPLVLPMARAAVRAMDMTEEILSGLDSPVPVDGFVVAGASKRGWTSWIAGALDGRVKAIAPIVINVANMTEHLAHHRAAYGYWSPAIYDYAQERVFDQMLPVITGEEALPEAQALLDIVDPYNHLLKGRYPMPLFMLNATGDEFFVPDTAEYYFHDMKENDRLCYVPNVGHGMGGLGSSADITDSSNPLGMFLAWHMAVTQGKTIPQFTYSFEEDGAIRVETDPANPPSAVRLWRVEQPTPGLRDFRNHKLPEDAWTPVTLQAQSQHVYVTPAPEPTDGHYMAFFVQLEYNNEAQFHPGLRLILQGMGYTVPNLVFSTGVRVWPEASPEFTGYVANELRADAVPFGEEKLPVIVVYGTPYEMGNYYGQLMADEINTFIPAYIDAYKTDTGMDDAWLTAAWEQAAAVIDPRIVEEIQGIAEAPGVSVTLAQLEHAHAAMLREPTGAWSAATTSVYRELMGGTDAGHAITLNGPMTDQLRQTQCAIVYIPDSGVPHVVFTHAGLAIGRVGANLGGISAVEIADANDGVNVENTLSLTRSILYDALSLRQAITQVKAAPPQYATTLALGDGRNEQRSVLLRTDASGGIVDERYDMVPDFGATNRGIVYAAITPELEEELRTSIAAYMQQGPVSLANLAALAGEQPFAEAGHNLLNIVIDARNMELVFSTADSVGDAGRPDTDFYLQELLP